MVALPHFFARKVVILPKSPDRQAVFRCFPGQISQFFNTLEPLYKTALHAFIRAKVSFWGQPLAWHHGH